jgi:hypothetical protein
VEAVKELEEQAGILDGDGADAKPTLILGAADAFPGDEALGAVDFVRGRPEESTAQPIQSGEHTRGKLKSSHGKGWQSVEHSVEEDQPPTGGQKESFPASQVLVHLGNEGIERGEAQLLGGQREAEVRLGESLDAALKNRLDTGKDARLDMHGHQGAFVVVDRQPSGTLELTEEELQALSRGHIGAQDQEGVVGVL